MPISLQIHLQRNPIGSLLRVAAPLLLCFLAGCATYKPQEADGAALQAPVRNTPEHVFFLAGGLGNGPLEADGPHLETFRKALAEAGENSTLIYTGDQVSDQRDDWNRDKAFLDRHLALTESFKGEVIFIPGGNEWKSYDTERVEAVENYIKDLDKPGLSFFPENACPIERRVISDKLDLVLIDSKWFISNWSRIEDINKKCPQMVTRRRFRAELKDAIDDNLEKNIVIAMHHPVFSNGAYAGYKSLRSHLLPFPIAGTITSGIMDLGAFDPDHLNSRRYDYLRIMVASLAQLSERITVVSGHEENLQFLGSQGLYQIISGSLGPASPARLSADQITAIGGSLPFEGRFAHGAQGFAKLEYFANGQSQVTFYGSDYLEEGKTYPVLEPFPDAPPEVAYPTGIEPRQKKAVLEDSTAYQKSGFHRFLWGDRYRSYYGTPVIAPVVNLDTLYGGLKVTKVGGGQQSFSLRLEDASGRQYSMRSLRKSALKFLKFWLPGVSYNEEDYAGSLPADIVSDFFTSAHPYMQLVVDPLAEAVAINHSDTRLFYVPKQPAMGKFNTAFGDELYFIERRPSEEQQDYPGYRRVLDGSGEVTDYESSTDMLEKIQSDESYTVDQQAYIKARVLDILLGDWDRHQDQWRWIEYEGKEGDRVFIPIPRDRDNVFPRFDGFALKLIQLMVPNTRQWQSYDGEVENIKWLNLSGSGLDRTLLTEAGIPEWVSAAEAIQKGLTPEVVAKAFDRLPEEVQDSTAAGLERDLLRRLETLPETARAYAEYLNRTVVIRGTEKDDRFLIERKADGQTEIAVWRILSDEEDEEIYRRTFKASVSRELWVYGLGDDDVFEIKGNADQHSMVRIVGGYGEDHYAVDDKRRLRIYDWRHEESNFSDKTPRKTLSNLYKTNTYHWRYFKPDRNSLAPELGFRTDDGLFLGLTDTYTVNGLHGNPFVQKHSLRARYYFGFDATELEYEGSFGHIFPNWNLELGGFYTSDRYARNFFGLGNDTPNNEDALDIDFYRARVAQFRSFAGLSFYTLKIRMLYESFRVQDLSDRFFNPGNFQDALFETQRFLGAQVSGYYKRSNARDFPTKALYFGFLAGYKANLGSEAYRFGFASLRLGVDHKLIPSGNLVLSTTAEYRSNIGNDEVFFYHAPSIGGNNGLRGFRDERFSGKSSFYQSSDLKLRLNRTVTPVFPVTLGVFAGFDYGRVWVPGQESGTWHTSQGGGLWISSLKALTLSAGYFNSNENNMVQVGFGLSF